MNASLGRHLAVAALTALFTCLLSLLPIVGHLEQKGYDLFHLFQEAAEPPEGVVIVAIDDPSFAELQRQWPWPRSIHARLIDTLKAEGASVIAFDVVFAEPSLPGEDRQLARAIRSAGNVVLASELALIGGAGYRQEMVVEPDPLFREWGRSGVATISPDRDNVVRRIPTRGAEQTLFAEQVAAASPKKGGTLPGEGYISFAGPPGSFRTVSYYQALEPSSYLPANLFRNKIVLIGKATQSTLEPEKQLGDHFATPFLFSHGGLMSGVEIHANLVRGLVSGEFVTRLGRPGSYLLFALAALAGSLLQYRWRPVLGLASALAACAGYLLLAYLSFVLYRHWLPTLVMAVPFTLPYALFGGRAYLLSERKRKELRRAFSHYLSPSVLEAVLADPERLRLGGERVEASILFSDIAGFTTISESMRPEEVAQLINLYLDRMTGEILERKGTVDKFIGDAIMAFWGAPLPDPEHALNACRAALAMQERLGPLRGELAQQGMPELSIRIGINSGQVVAGNMGSSSLFDYTVLGDAVNLASRLEGANKEFGTSILISRAVYDQCAGRIEARPLGSVRVKGKSQEVEVYELVGMRS